MKTTLTNPTPAEIDAAVAEHVAGWKRVKAGNFGKTGLEWFLGYSVPPPNDLFFPPGLPPEANVNRKFPVPPYSTSADAVLPLLKNVAWKAGSLWNADGFPERCFVQIYDGQKYSRSQEDTFPLAACLALLRAHGVAVEFAEGK